jgi:hypothetical protein
MNFKANKAVQIDGRPMFRCERSLLFCKRLVKLMESVVNLLEKMIELKLCKDPKHPVKYSVNYVMGKVKGAHFWLNVGWQMDKLTPLVSNEMTETDPESLLFCSEICLREMKRLVNEKNPGSKDYQKLMNIIEEKSRKGVGDDWNQARMSSLY